MAVPVPFVTVARAAMQTLRDADVATLASAPDLTLRWLRNRYTDPTDEGTTVSLAFVSDEPADAREQYLSASEGERVLALDIIADGTVETETAAEDDDLDIDRVEGLAGLLAACVKALRRGFIDPAEDPTALTAVSHWVQELGISEDEDMVDREGRLVARINVLYRVRSDDPTILLPTGFNGS